MSTVNSSRFNFKDSVDWGLDKFINDYQADVIREMSEVIPEVAKESVKRLKAESPKGAHSKKHKGTYAKGWTYKVEKGRLKVGATVYGKKGTYNLAHLLEYGHVIRTKGGRKSGEAKDAKAIPHIEKIDKWASDEVYERVMRRLSAL